ncbi:hypothetical protein M413DRAFT_13760 [Hebeloma cylindrosporum]|uniref:GED domain-containing protein n=1 Tax=Hebeloma cylindrosporum TaxID=76867 RepID=A0A0C3BZC2_HEBCY|nr:hypothetical protein M413DRAFT_13760 [Hebeloma cylindrosporum h7]
MSNLLGQVFWIPLHEIVMHENVVKFGVPARLRQTARGLDEDWIYTYRARHSLAVPPPTSESTDRHLNQVRMASPATPTTPLPPGSPVDGDVNTSTSVSIGLSNPQLTHNRQLLEVTNKLQNTGVSNDLDVPQITVVGQQSSGKSSLIEAMSGVPFPRDKGTCTRCPMECRLSRSAEPWQCIVSLRFSHDQKRQALDQVTNPQFGEIIYDRTEVEERIRRAQRAVLNPELPLDYFLEGRLVAAENGPQTTFTMNCVSLRISGPDVVDLSFCDLPGLIASVADGGNDGDIALVQNMVSSYIQKPSCIILLVVACETDFENQGAHRLAKKFDPEGKRTLGVLTKPDRIPKGEESSWFSFIRNEKEPLKNGWFCVKQPDSEALKAKITWSKARENEINFFASQLWTELELEYQRRLGTENLVKKLSVILSDLIAKRLPEIRKEVERKSAQLKLQLAGFPPEPSSDPRSDILRLLHEFSSDIGRHTWGVPDDPDSCFGGLGLIQAIRLTQEKFRKAIRATAPNFQPFKRLEDAPGKVMGSVDFLGKDTDEFNGQELDLDEAHLVSSYLKLMEIPHSEEIYVDEVLATARRLEESIPLVPVLMFPLFNFRAVTRELPGHFPFVVQQNLVQDIIKKWEFPALNLCAIIRAMTNAHVNSLVKRHFGNFGRGILEDRIRTLLQQRIGELCTASEDRIKWLCCLEGYPFTLNTHYLSDYQSKFLAHYRAARQKYDSSNLLSTVNAYSPEVGQVYNSNNRSYTAAPPTGVGKVLAGLLEIKMSGVKPEDLLKLLPPDPMDPALVIMADVRAYFQVAYKRFVDNVPLAIDVGIVRGLQKDILLFLCSNLGINGSDGHQICVEFAKEDNDMAARRLDLKKRLTRLELARRELLNVSI